MLSNCNNKFLDVLEKKYETVKQKSIAHKGSPKTSSASARCQEVDRFKSQSKTTS